MQMQKARVRKKKGEHAKFVWIQEIKFEGLAQLQWEWGQATHGILW